MEVNPIIFESWWDTKGKCEMQVLPHPKEPGCFISRIVLRLPGRMQSGINEKLNQILGCQDISSFHIFIEGQTDDGEITVLSPGDALSIMPANLFSVFHKIAFQDRIEYFRIPTGTTLENPIYPVWTRDIQRSMQVVNGEYSEIVPMVFEFIPTLNCIFRCHECAYREPKERLGLWKRNDFSPDFHMDEATMRILLKKLKDAGVSEVLFTGGGEPLLNDATPNAMKYACDALGMRVGIYTNGALINENKAKAIMDARPAYVRVSLNAGRRHVYYQHHNPLNPDPKTDYFENAQGAIGLLAMMKDQLQSTTTLGVSYLVDPGNADDIINGARLVASWAIKCQGKIDYMRFTPSVNYFGPRQHPKEIFESVVDQIQKIAVPELNAAGVEARVYFHRFSGLYEKRPYDQCLAAGWYGGIGPGGVMYWCCEKLFNHNFAFGSLLNDSFDDLWSGGKRREVINFVSQAVKGGTDSPCPVVCKPHEHNKVFAKIERLRVQGRIEIVKAWLKQIHKIISSTQKDAKPRLDGFQS